MSHGHIIKDETSESNIISGLVSNKPIINMISLLVHLDNERILK